ncbi:MAG: hypothetical protein HKN48_02810, partial [Flavobacteriaceae bacterium]|nr:hypothetical protein [Flavobacteriaceae bacterium]
MKRLIKSLQFLGLAFICFSITNCAGGKDGKDSAFSLEQEAPFTIQKAYFQKWVAGVQAGGSGTNVYLT